MTKKCCSKILQFAKRRALALSFESFHNSWPTVSSWNQMRNRVRKPSKSYYHYRFLVTYNNPSRSNSFWKIGTASGISCHASAVLAWIASSLSRREKLASSKWTDRLRLTLGDISGRNRKQEICRLRLSLHVLRWLRIKSQTARLKLWSILRRNQKLRLPLPFSLTKGQGSLRRRVAFMLFSTFHSGETKSIVVSELGSQHPTDPPSDHCSAEKTLLWVKHPGCSYLQNLLSSQSNLKRL